MGQLSPFSLPVAFPAGDDENLSKAGQRKTPPCERGWEILD